MEQPAPAVAALDRPAGQTAAAWTAQWLGGTGGGCAGTLPPALQSRGQAASQPHGRRGLAPHHSGAGLQPHEGVPGAQHYEPHISASTVPVHRGNDVPQPPPS